MYIQPYPNLFKPLNVRNLKLKNRIISAPNMLFQTVDGRPNDYYISYLEHKARGGASIVTLGEANVCDGGNHTPGMEMTHDNRSLYGEMAAAIHEHGAYASVELTHGGMNARPQFNLDPGLIMGPSELQNPMTGARVKAMTPEDMERVANAFADAAEYYLTVGFDTVLLHVAHGWLLTQFLSPLTNRRTDEYGGSFENRMKFPLRVLRTVRERVGQNQALTMRLSGSERRPDGFTTQDIITFLERAQEYVDLTEISSEDLTWFFATTYMPHCQNAPLAEEIKKSGKVTIPVYTVGSIVRPEEAEEIIATGRADGVSMSRALIADPYWPKKAATGRADEITPCLRCLNCTDSDNFNRHLVCSVNPLLGREARLGFGGGTPKAREKARVLVVGGGPAGMTAAITAAGRGHEVTLAERGERLGGWLKFTDADSLKNDLRRYKDFLVRGVKDAGIRVLLNASPDGDCVDRSSYDHIIVATGSVPVVPTFIKGYEKAAHATAAYFAPERIRDGAVVIIGGGLVGVETALHLANTGRSVTVLEARDELAADAKGCYKMGLMRKVFESGIVAITGAGVKEILDGGVRYEKDGKEMEAPAESVLYAVGMRSDDALYYDLYTKAPFVTLVGDAKRVGKVDGAVHSGYFAAMDI
ncbi:MAG: FAD-dependent oxidoreductase [Oscillospiraceae bacterium]|jgi:2,4-dienoyl-CoA reductase-like NADH-dependent reductase (Old Yellow Enzyme family)/thioredoxin reductase|nr:FAD-dependent oxidoreductase [Oscillospiraceae bacterium]